MPVKRKPSVKKPTQVHVVTVYLPDLGRLADSVLALAEAYRHRTDTLAAATKPPEEPPPPEPDPRDEDFRLWLSRLPGLEQAAMDDLLGTYDVARDRRGASQGDVLAAKLRLRALGYTGI